MFGKFDPIPNDKTDTNNHGPFSTDNIGMNYDYPEASYERRREILARARELPERVTSGSWPTTRACRRTSATQMSQWGLAKDEFTDNGDWPHQIYVREARRMVGDFVMTEAHLRRQKPTPRFRRHGLVQHGLAQRAALRRHATAGPAPATKATSQVSPGGPYPIAYRAIVPKEAECANLLVPVCVSCTHIAYGSIRMEPVFMILGQSAATAACHGDR